MKKLKHIPDNPNHFLMILLGIWLILNILQGAFIELANDEAYYWFISSDLSWGYFDHPPLFALLTWLGTNILGDSELGIRFFTILLQPLYLYLFWTIVRTERSDWKSALTYFLIAFSIPQLQLYGWVVTPDAPLLMMTALLLWSYNRYLQKEDLFSTLLIGLSIALLAYSKYQGALVVILLIASNFKLLKQWRFWIAILVAAILIIPHILWQYQHDWVSFRYHLSDRNGVFELGYIFEFILNVIGTFHPFIIIPFIIYLVKQRSKTSIERTLRFIAIGFVAFFLFSSLRGYIQPQWVIPVVFAILYTMTRAAERSVKFQRYIIRVGLITSVIFIVVRIFTIVYSGDWIKYEIFNNHESYQALADEVDGRTLIFEGSYTKASKMNYYSDGRAIAYPSIYDRSSHYQLRDTLDENLYGQKVAVVVPGNTYYKIPKEKRNQVYHYFQLYNSNAFYYDTVDFYIPTRQVEIKYKGLPENTLVNRPITLELDIYNPYDYNIPLNQFELKAQFKVNNSKMCEVVLPWKQLKTLNPKSHNSLKVEFIVPRTDSGEYKFGLTIQRPPATSWYNSERTKIYITDPSQTGRH